MSRDVALALAVFLACFVEGVEAVTIVLAAGLTRGWRSAWAGVAAALAALTALVALLGPTLTGIPIESLRLVVGGLLLIFGLQWLRKAILRAGGLKALHDEDAIFATEVAELAAQPKRPSRIDPFAFTVSFKGVFLEGLEVVFIVLTFGANQHNIPLAAAAAGAAVAVVLIIGAAMHRPLARIPENSLKFVVGVLLTSFGMFWGVEGAGGSWPGADAAIPVVVALTAVTAFALVAILRRAGGRTRPVGDQSVVGQ